MGRRKRIVTKSRKKAYCDLDIDYRLNETNDSLVEALNSLPTDERSLMVLYISMGCNKAEVARSMNCSDTLIRYRIKAITQKIKDRI